MFTWDLTVVARILNATLHLNLPLLQSTPNIPFEGNISKKEQNFVNIKLILIWCSNIVILKLKNTIFRGY